MTRRAQRGAANPFRTRSGCTVQDRIPVRILPGVLFSQYPLEALPYPCGAFDAPHKIPQRDL